MLYVICRWYWLLWVVSSLLGSSCSQPPSLATSNVYNDILSYAAEQDCSGLPVSEQHTAAASLLQLGIFRNEKYSAEIAYDRQPETKISDIPRPGLAGGNKDEIKFGILAKRFYDIEFSHNSFSVDLVLSLHWVDTRVPKLLPSNASQMYLPISLARKTMWLPDVTVTNRDLAGIEVITSSVKIREDGHVTQVDRLIASVKCGFNATSFPFDSQRLRIRIASSTYMTDALVLLPSEDPKLFGVVGGDVSNSFNFVSSEQISFVEVNGDLSRSRGELDIVIQRKTYVFMETILLPTLAIVISSWAGFWIPIEPQAFLMPRVATSFLAFLALVTTCRKIDSMLPQRGEQAWSDVFTECCICEVFAAEILTMLVQFVHYSQGLAELAHQIDLECRVFLPSLFIFTSGLCYLGKDQFYVWAMSWIVRISLALLIGGYLMACTARCLRKKPSEEP